MMKSKIIYLVLILILSPALARPVFSGSEAADYLCEVGISFYRAGRYDEAIHEFKKALLIDPGNELAREYISKIFEKEASEGIQKVAEKPSRDQAISMELERLTKKKIQEPGIKITGEAQVRLGFTSEDTYWKRANWDLNEKNWRMLNNNAINLKENTYDPRIYDRLKFKLDAKNYDGFGFHANINIDPWSYTGKSEKITISEPAGDSAEIELKYLGSSKYTLNEIVYTLVNGDTMALPEIKIQDGRTQSTPLTSAFGGVYTLPELEIETEFQPVREFWFDYLDEDVKFRFYPIAYENQAIAFDDPLRLSNNRIWWENSPWLNSWKPGRLNSGASPVDFTKGFWDKTNAFGIRDSEGQRLTSLRGFHLQLQPDDETYFVTSAATPKDVWQEYAEIDNFLSATRFKRGLTDSLDLGLSATTRFGFTTTDKWDQDAQNFVAAADVGFEIIDGIKANVELAHSESRYDMTDAQYRSKPKGEAYHFSLLGRFPQESIMNTEYGYNGIKPDETEEFFTKFKFYAVRMDDSFDQPLTSYVETRDDEWWGRHLHFREPFKYYYQGEGQTLTWDDVEPFKIGDGIDIGRMVLGLRIDSSLWDGRMDNLFAVRNVHDTDSSKFIENVARDEVSWEATDKLTVKLLGIYQKMPKTKAGIDPFIFDTRSREYFRNDYITDGADPSLKTGSLGMNYKFFDWFALHGIWERTNDCTLAYDNFPIGINNGGNNSSIIYDYENGNLYRDMNSWLNTPQLFPKPPYPYYDIFKVGMKFTPFEVLDIYLDYTRNEYEKAGQVDDNMNHVGLEIAYNPMRKFGIFLKYTYSRWQDLDRLIDGITKPAGHHNFFAEFIYRKSEDEDFVLQYGEASRNPYLGGVLVIGWDPYGGSLRTIDTQHILRLYYRRRF